MKLITSNNIKTSGFLKLLRVFNSSLFSKELDINEFGLLMVLVMNADWDRRHRNFGKLCISNKTLGKIKGLNRAKVSALKSSLTNKKYIKIIGIENSVDIIEILGFEKYQCDHNFGYAKIFKDLDRDLENHTNQ